MRENVSLGVGGYVLTESGLALPGEQPEPLRDSADFVAFIKKTWAISATGLEMLFGEEPLSLEPGPVYEIRPEGRAPWRDFSALAVGLPYADNADCRRIVAWAVFAFAYAKASRSRLLDSEDFLPLVYLATAADVAVASSVTPAEVEAYANALSDWAAQVHARGVDWAALRTGLDDAGIPRPKDPRREGGGLCLKVARGAWPFSAQDMLETLGCDLLLQDTAPEEIRWRIAGTPHWLVTTGDADPFWARISDKARQGAMCDDEVRMDVGTFRVQSFQGTHTFRLLRTSTVCPSE